MPSRLGLFEIFKYGIYLLLGLNLFSFFQQEWSATAFRFADGVSGSDIVSAFAASIDTAAWLVLLVLFELETTMLRDRGQGRTGALVIQSLTGLCYVLIVASFWGYASKVFLLSGFIPSPAEPCSLVGTGASLAIGFDEYVSFSPALCQTLAGVSLLTLPGLAIFATEEAATAQLWLAWVDVINSGAWLGVVAVLAADVYLQQRGRLSDGLMSISRVAKVFLYGALVVAAIYWTLRGDFVDAWDAWLWLVAFVFIEMNLFDWTSEQANSVASPA